MDTVELNNLVEVLKNEIVERAKTGAPVPAYVTAVLRDLMTYRRFEKHTAPITAGISEVPASFLKRRAVAAPTPSERREGEQLLYDLQLGDALFLADRAETAIRLGKLTMPAPQVEAVLRAFFFECPGTDFATSAFHIFKVADASVCAAAAVLGTCFWCADNLEEKEVMMKGILAAAVEAELWRAVTGAATPLPRHGDVDQAVTAAVEALQACRCFRDKPFRVLQAAVEVVTSSTTAEVWRAGADVSETVLRLPKLKGLLDDANDLAALTPRLDVRAAERARLSVVTARLFQLCHMKQWKHFAMVAYKDACQHREVLAAEGCLSVHADAERLFAPLAQQCRLDVPYFLATGHFRPDGVTVKDIRVAVQQAFLETSKD